MKTQPINAAEIDASQGETIALVSTERAEADHWTELRLIYLPDPSGRCFLAEVRGRSRIEGQDDRVRRAYVGSIERALKHFDQESDATHALALSAEDWMERHGERVKADVLRLREMERAGFQGRLGVGGLGFTGQGGLAGALRWLYPDQAIGLAAQLERDFGVPRRTVDHALSQEADGPGLTGWAKGFVSALMFFDREAFHATKGTADA